MKFNATFIRAIALTLEHAGEANAEELFNALFVQAAVKEVRKPADLLFAAREYSGVQVYGPDIRGINRDIGTPGPGWSRPVAWIKRAREVLGCGLKEAKDLHDFVRDNPTVANA
jgi:hypothetical protein